MKKSLVALAALAASGAAMAQSSVTIYGIVDAAYGHASSGGLSRNFLGSSQSVASRLGFTGSEDLGGGLKAIFRLEAGLFNDNGTGKATNTNNQASGATTVGGLTFNRYSYVGLSSNFGEVRLGRDYTSAFLQTEGALDPFSTNGPADSSNIMLKLSGSGKNGALGNSITTNASNMVEYISPSIYGFNVVGQYIMGENVRGDGVDNRSGNGYDVSAHYANGPISANIAQLKVKALATPTNAATTGDYTLTSFSAGYDFKVAKIIYTYAREKIDATTELYNKSNQLGVIVPIGAFAIRGSYIDAKTNADVIGTQTKGDLWALGVTYNLSKRTTLYTTYAHVKNKDGGSWYGTGGSNGVNDGLANNTGSNYVFGITHKF